MANSEGIERGSDRKRSVRFGANVGLWLVIGLTVGVFLGAMFGNVGIGIILGAAIGLLIGCLKR
jgi:hypothetical protein